jgi:nucleotide-binding universal stress UspA family protein
MSAERGRERVVSFRNILVPLDFGAPSRRALSVAIGLTKELGSSLTLMHTWEIPGYVHTGVEIPATELFHPSRDAAAERLAAALAEVSKDVPEAKSLLRGGAPWREILAAVEETGADLVVMGTHGRRGLARALLGSVTEKVVRNATVPVLTVGAEPAR